MPNRCLPILSTSRSENESFVLSDSSRERRGARWSSVSSRAASVSLFRGVLDIVESVRGVGCIGFISREGSGREGDECLPSNDKGDRLTLMAGALPSAAAVAFPEPFSVQCMPQPSPRRRSSSVIFSNPFERNGPSPGAATVGRGVRSNGQVRSGGHSRHGTLWRRVICGRCVSLSCSQGSFVEANLDRSVSSQ